MQVLTLFQEIFALFGIPVRAWKSFFNTQEDIIDILLWKNIFCSLIYTVFFFCFEPLFYFKTGNYPCVPSLSISFLSLMA